jgi:hypothetical protein
MLLYYTRYDSAIIFTGWQWFFLFPEIFSKVCGSDKAEIDVKESEVESLNPIWHVRSRN